MFSPRGPSQRRCRHLREGGNPQSVFRPDQALESSAIRSRKWSRRETVATTVRSFALCIALAAAGLTLAATGSGATAAAPDEVREIAWEELMPQGWSPLAVLDALMGDDQGDLDALPDSSLRAIELFNAYQEAVRSAPVVRELNGRKIRLPGFVVPLDFEGVEISEFLLVPYFGACIHVPPPPSNQIVYVKTVASYPLQGLFDPVWVTGEIRTDAYPNDLGDAGYTLQATIIEPY